MLYRERLRPDHDVDTFTSANGTLDRWLQTSAEPANRAGTGRTYVWVNESDTVVAYFTLAPHVVRRSELPAKIGRGSPDAIPAVLLARLALTTSLQRQPERYGTVLLLDALDTALRAMRQVGGRLVVVDAIDDDAQRFYQHHGFAPVPDNPRRLVIKASTAAKALDITWP